MKFIYYSFPIQLLILHVKKNKSLLLWWLLLFGIITYNIGASYGGAYLFLDPEYLGKVNFLSFFWIGWGFGFFLLAWNIATYMTNAFRFPFLATLHSPFFHFCINNSLIPLAFVVTYLIAVSRFQAANEFRATDFIFSCMGGFFTGAIALILVGVLYFHLTNKNISSFINHLQQYPKPTKYNKYTRSRRPKLSRQQRIKQLEQQLETEVVVLWESIEKNAKICHVDYYLTSSLHIRLARSTQHYPEKVLQSVFRQNHLNAFFVQLVSLLVLVGLGLGIDVPWLQVPAATNFFVVFALLLSFISALSYWLTEWRTVVFVALLMILNYSTTYDWYRYDTPAYGLNYHTTKATYNLSEIKRLHTPQQAQQDQQNTLPLLAAWKQRAQAAQQLPANQKPTMVLLCYSGGGSRASTWGMWATQQTDSLLNNQLLPSTVLMTGASGGMVAATYLRELYYRQQIGSLANWHKQQYWQNMAKDLLNPIAFTMAVNDIFYPTQRFTIAGNEYIKNRAYSFENRWHANTDSVLFGRTLAQYTLPEQQGIIPMLILSPTITNDSRKLYISSQPVSYLVNMPTTNTLQHPLFEFDGIDFGLFFKHQNAPNLLISSAARLNATYPYILPTSVLPTNPPLQIMDAGFIDNFGIETAVRFLQTFNTWINANTQQVVIVRITSQQKIAPTLPYQPETLLQQFFTPFAVFMSPDVQEYNQDQRLVTLNQQLNNKLSVVNLEYLPSSKNAEASMSFHLTTREKNEIKQALNNQQNQQAIKQLKALINPKTQ